MKFQAALLAIACGIGMAQAGDLPEGMIVRVEGSGIEAGWHEGTIAVTSEGCSMVKLVKPTKDGYTMIALAIAKRLQRKQGSGWIEVSLPALKLHEPKACAEGSD
jgi:hypothetical protein